MFGDDGTTNGNRRDSSKRATGLNERYASLLLDPYISWRGMPLWYRMTVVVVPVAFLRSSHYGRACSVFQYGGKRPKSTSPKIQGDAQDNKVGGERNKIFGSGKRK